MKTCRTSAREFVLVVSYFSSTQGNCPAEWCDDKIRSLHAKGIKSILITGVGSAQRLSDLTEYVIVPSLSWIDFQEEIKELKRSGQPTPRIARIIYPFAWSIGRLIDYFVNKITGTMSSGRWSWVITSSIAVLYLSATRSVICIFTTGGPSSAHIAGTMSKFLGIKRIVAEFQDPLVGSCLTKSRSKRIAVLMERYLASVVTRMVMVTRVAAEDARQRQVGATAEIVYIYPGAWRHVEPLVEESNKKETLEIAHVGTLYGTRSLENYFKALKLLKAKTDFCVNIKTITIGSDYTNVPSMQTDIDYQIIPGLDRIDALRRAQQSDILLLVQHTDLRSVDTIPFKTYDYINLKMPIFALSGSTELSEMIERQNGVTAQATDVVEIAQALHQVINICMSKHSCFTDKDCAEGIDCIDQLGRMLEFGNE